MQNCFVYSELHDSPRNGKFYEVICLIFLVKRLEMFQSNSAELMTEKKRSVIFAVKSSACFYWKGSIGESWHALDNFLIWSAVFEARPYFADIVFCGRLRNCSRVRGKFQRHFLKKCDVWLHKEAFLFNLGGRSQAAEDRVNRRGSA